MVRKSYGRNTEGIAQFAILAGGGLFYAVVSYFEGILFKAFVGVGLHVYALWAIRQLARRPYLILEPEGVRIHDLSKRDWFLLLPEPAQPYRLIKWNAIRTVERAGYSKLILDVGSERIPITLDTLSRRERNEMLGVIEQFIHADGRLHVD